MRPSAIVGWTGTGRLADLERSATRKLGARARPIGKVDGTLLFDSADPVEAARELAYLPGVAWIAVGYRFTGQVQYERVLEALGKKYLRKGAVFSVSARSEGGGHSAGDLVLSGNSTVLSLFPGSRISESKPQVRFRVCMQGDSGACGVEIRSGPGGTPTGSERVSVLVSGGARSAYLAWAAALSGFAVRLVHSKTDERSLGQAARLYSELSSRLEPSRLELVLLQGNGDPEGRVWKWLESCEGLVFAGLRPRAREVVRLSSRFPNLSLPLLLVQEDVLSSGYRSLGIGPASSGRGLKLPPRKPRADARFSEKVFGGVRADTNEVIDALRS